jgi:rhodanese-related sulfurtransferase
MTGAVRVDARVDGPRLGAVHGPEYTGRAMEPYAAISPAELKRRIDAGAPPALLDVREVWEHELGALSGARHIPMDELEARAGELDAAQELVVYCHHGQRSAAVVQWLRRQGVPALNLQGGIDAWAEEVDPSVPRY